MWYIDIIRGTWSAVNGGSTLAPLHQHCPMLKCSRTIKLISVAPFMESFFFWWLWLLVTSWFYPPCPHLFAVLPRDADVVILIHAA
uniref:Uncharacterized protein n=1 Tax=Setaria italica TaxID=4555 RepID=K3XNT1_SETIT